MEDNINMDPKETGADMMNWMECALDRDHWRVLVSAALNLQVT